MKDWQIKTNDFNRTFLVHVHGTVNYRCYKEPKGKWQCRFCSVSAPEEIGFCAELAGCVADIWGY